MSNRGINKVTLIGNLGQDPEIRYTQENNAVVNLSIATSESWKDKVTGEQKEIVDWHRVVIFGKLAEIIGEYAKKGSQLYIEGKLKTRKWQDKQNVDHYTTEIIVNHNGVAQILGSKDSNVKQENIQSPKDNAPPIDDDIPY